MNNGAELIFVQGRAAESQPAPVRRAWKTPYVIESQIANTRTSGAPLTDTTVTAGNTFSNSS